MQVLSDESSGELGSEAQASESGIESFVSRVWHDSERVSGKRKKWFYLCSVKYKDITVKGLFFLVVRDTKR